MGKCFNNNFHTKAISSASKVILFYLYFLLEVMEKYL